MSATRPGLEALAQAVLERLQVVRRAVGAEDDLASAVVQRVEGVEELLLGLRLALEELDVVDQQHVDVAEAGLEVLGVAVAERAEELVRERLAGREANREAGVVGEQQARDRAEQVRLADAGRAADEQRVVGAARASRRPSARRRGRAGWSRRSRTGRRSAWGFRAARGACGLGRGVHSPPPQRGGVEHAARRVLGEAVLACAAGDELDGSVRAEHQRDGGLDHPAEAAPGSSGRPGAAPRAAGARR